jgi:hypothetical protein
MVQIALPVWLRGTDGVIGLPATTAPGYPTR